MRVGVSLRSRHDVTDVREGARWMVERARAARRAGLDSLFVGDHHAVGLPYYQNTAILGRLLADWGHETVGALYLLPLWHPVLVAEQVGTLASIASGRFVMQCAVGGDEAQFAAMGESLRTRATRFERSLDAIRRMLAGEEVTVRVGPWDIRRARVNPITPEPLEVWIGAAADAAVDRAARMGDGWLADPSLVPSEARDLAARYRERCAVHGRRPTAVAIRRDVHVGSDDADAQRVADGVLRGGYRGFRPEALVVGGPDRVADRFRELASYGYTDVIVRHLADDQRDVLASFERLAQVRELLSDTPSGDAG